jgi:magnesium-transporting ATPase (P-type)
MILNVLMGFFQECNAKKTLYALRKIVKPTTMVKRGAKKACRGKRISPRRFGCFNFWG